MSEPYEWTDASGTKWLAFESDGTRIYYELDGVLRYPGGGNGARAAVRELLRLAAEVAEATTRADFLATQHKDFQEIIAASRERVAALEKLLSECACAIEGEDTADFAWSGANVENLHFLVAEVRAALGEEAKDG